MNGQDEFDRLAVAWVEATVADEQAPERLRRRLLATVSGPGRFALLADALGRFADLGRESLTALLAKVDDPSAWRDAPFAGVRYFHFTPGRGAGPVEAGFVRLRPGALFPRHRHLGVERGFVLDGLLLDRGASYGPGGIIESAAGTEHDYAAGPGRDLVIVSLHQGIEFVG